MGILANQYPEYFIADTENNINLMLEEFIKIDIQQVD